MNQSKYRSPILQLAPSRSISQLTYSTNSAQVKHEKDASHTQINQLWDQQQSHNEVEIPDNPIVHEAVALIQKLRVNQALEILIKDVAHGRQYLGVLSHYQQVSSIINILTTSAMNLLHEQSSSSLLLLLGCDQLIRGLNPKQQATLRVQVLNGLGCYYRKTDQIDKALMELEKALHEIKHHRLKDVAITHLNLSVVLSTVEEHEGALENAKKAVIESHKLLQTYVDQKLLKSSPRFLRCVSTLSISFYNVGVQEHFYQRYQLALQAYASSFKIAEDNLGEDHILTQQLRNVYEQFARELALAEAQKLSLQTLKSTKILLGNQLSNQKPIRPQTAATKGSYISYLGLQQKPPLARPSSGISKAQQSQLVENSQTNTNQLSVTNQFTQNDMNRNIKMRPRSAVSTYKMKAEIASSNVILQANKSTQADKNTSFNIRKTSTTKNQARQNNYTDREASESLIQSHKTLKEELSILQTKAQEERRILLDLQEQRINETHQLSILSKTIISKSGKTIKITGKKIIKTDPSFSDYHSQKAIQLDESPNLKSIKKNKAAQIIQQCWRSKGAKLNDRIYKMSLKKQMLVDKDYAILSSNQKTAHDGFLWGWFNYKSCTFQLVFIDLFVLRKSKKPQKLDKIIIDSTKLIHTFTLFVKLQKVQIMDMFAQDNQDKQLINNKKLSDFLGIIYRKLKSKMKIIWNSQTRQYGLRADLNEFIMLFYQEKLKLIIQQKIDVCFININYKVKNTQLVILQIEKAKIIQHFWTSKQKKSLVVEEVLPQANDINTPQPDQTENNNISQVQPIYDDIFEDEQIQPLEELIQPLEELIQPLEELIQHDKIENQDDDGEPIATTSKFIQLNQKDDSDINQKNPMVDQDEKINTSLNQVQADEPDYSVNPTEINLFKLDLIENSFRAVEPMISSIAKQYTDQGFRSINDLTPLIFEMQTSPDIEGFLFTDFDSTLIMRVYLEEHKKAVVYLQRYFKLVHFQRKFKVKIPKHQKSGELFVGRRAKTNTIYVAVTTIDENKRNFYKFSNESYRQFIEKLQIRIMSNLKYSEEDGIFLLQEPEHQIVAFNLQAKIYAHNGPSQKRFEYQGAGLLNAIYDVLLKKIIIASDDTNVAAVQVDIPKECKSKEQITAFAEGILNKVYQNKYLQSFIMANNQEKCVIYYEQRDEESVLKIQHKFRSNYVFRSFKIAYNFFENGHLQKRQYLISLLQRNFFTLHIKVTNNEEKFVEYEVGRLDKNIRDHFIRNFTRFCCCFSEFNSKSHFLEVDVGMLVQFSSKMTNFVTMDVGDLENELELKKQQQSDSSYTGMVASFKQPQFSMEEQEIRLLAYGLLHRIVESSVKKVLELQ